MNTLTATRPQPDLAAVKNKQNEAWGSGDYAKIGVTLQIVGEELAERMDLTPGARVLDVAAGNGNATLAFARRECQVTSTDYVERLLVRGRARADAEGLDIQFRLADAENLPFETGSFDAVVSTFGVMFTPDQKQAANELARVCRPGGRIGMANWTPDGFIGQLFKTLGGHVAPPPGVNSPALWGREDWLNETFGPAATEISITPKDFVFRARSPEDFVAFFRTYYGPMRKAFAALPTDRQAALHADLIELIGSLNTAADGSMRVPAHYAEVVISRR
jgi:SAM-dependent methyltransferase